ncbi:MAG: hypothetical protein HAW67_03350 [Endozoicomonadaceae bacterium]|nr:hypothetical protein [Endozoicomonadaceae bacterium]
MTLLSGYMDVYSEIIYDDLLKGIIPSDFFAVAPKVLTDLVNAGGEIPVKKIAMIFATIHHSVGCVNKLSFMFIKDCFKISQNNKFNSDLIEQLACQYWHCDPRSVRSLWEQERLGAIPSAVKDVLARQEIRNAKLELAGMVSDHIKMSSLIEEGAGIFVHAKLNILSILAGHNDSNGLKLLFEKINFQTINCEKYAEECLRKGYFEPLEVFIKNNSITSFDSIINIAAKKGYDVFTKLENLVRISIPQYDKAFKAAVIKDQIDTAKYIIETQPQIGPINVHDVTTALRNENLSLALWLAQSHVDYVDIHCLKHAVYTNEPQFLEEFLTACHSKFQNYQNIEGPIPLNALVTPCMQQNCLDSLQYLKSELGQFNNTIEADDLFNIIKEDNSSSLVKALNIVDPDKQFLLNTFRRSIEAKSFSCVEKVYREYRTHPELKTAVNFKAKSFEKALTKAPEIKELLDSINLSENLIASLKIDLDSIEIVSTSKPAIPVNSL